MSSLPLPPEPALSPLKQTLRFGKDPFAFLARMRAECGEIFMLRMLGMGTWVFLCSARHLSEVYKIGEDRVVAGEIRKRVLAYLFGARASISLDGEEYAHRRRVMMPHFGGRHVLQHTGLIHQLTAEKTDRWEVGEELELQAYFNRISTETASRVLFGPLDAQPALRLLPLTMGFLEALQPPVVQLRPLQWNLGRFNAFGRFVAARQALYEALDTEIHARQCNGGLNPETPPEDVLAALIAAELYEDEEICRKSIVHELVAAAVGGAETTAKVLAWTVLGVLSNPEILQRLRRELDEVLADRPIANEDLRRLPYLHAIIQEGMRYQSVGPFAGPRLVKKDIEVGGYLIPAGTAMAQCLQEVGRSEVFPNPEEFDPRNFLERKVKPRDWVPFGGGLRMCTGMGLAQLELAVVVGTLFQRLDLELGSGPTHPTKSGIAFQPANGLRVKILGQRLSQGSNDNDHVSCSLNQSRAAPLDSSC